MQWLSGAQLTEQQKSEIPWEELRYAAFARRFGWTPPVVDELPLALEPWLLPIADVLDADEARRENEAADRATKKAKG